MKSSKPARPTAYHREQLQAWQDLIAFGSRFSVAERHALKSWIQEYLAFREHTAQFLKAYFESVCTQKCYQDNTSACCSKDGIVVFFGDLVVNLLVSGAHETERLIQRLQGPVSDTKCLYLGRRGCLWKLKPIVCEMFLCDTAQSRVLIAGHPVTREWEALLAQRKKFTWPDRPVLFDRLESHFMEAGLNSPLMYLHNSPGLLRIKQQAGLHSGGLRKSSKPA